MLAAYKIRAVPINVNYRYVEAELTYLFDDADLVALDRATTSSLDSARAAAGPEAAAHVGGGRGRRLRGRARRPRRRTRPDGADRTRRRPLLRVHRRHDRHAQGRAVAPRGHLLRRHGRRRSDADGQHASPADELPSRDPGVRPRRLWSRRRSCTPARSGPRSRCSSAAARSSFTPGRPLRRARDPHADRRGEGQHARDRRRRHGPTAASTRWRRRARHLRHVVADRHRFGRRDPVVVDEGGDRPAAADDDDRRRLRLVRDRRAGHAGRACPTSRCSR